MIAIISREHPSNVYNRPENSLQADRERRSKMKKQFCTKVLCGILALLIALSMCVIASAATGDITGTAGSGITWKLDTNGKLTVTGSGKMTSMTVLPSNKTKVKSIVIGNGITEINSYAFDGCPNLTSVSLPATMQVIGYSAFEDCTGLTTISLPANLTTIAGYAFSGCSKLNGVTIPSKVTTVGSSSFKNCTSLTSINIPASVTSFPYYAFQGCTKLATVSFDARMENCEFSENFANCPALTAINVPAGNPMYSSKDGVVFDKAGTKLLYCPQGKSGAYSIPGTVTKIDFDAFKGCARLTSVTIPEGVEDVYIDTFRNCSSLKSVTFPRSLTSIGSNAFAGCALTAVTLYESVIYIANNAFDSGIVFTVPEDSYAAKWAKQNGYTVKLTAREYKVVIFCDSKYGTATATPACGKAGTKVTLKATANAGYKFTGWRVSTGGVTIKNNKFTLGKSDVYIYANFEKDKSSAVVKGIQYKLDAKKKTAIVVAPDKKTVSSVSIPATIKANGTKYKVVEIAANAFKGCTSLTKVTIGAEITKIGKNAFNGCKKLKTIDIKTAKLTKKGIGSSCFKNIDAKATFKCPKKMKKDYKTWLVKTGKAPSKAKFK